MFNLLPGFDVVPNTSCECNVVAIGGQARMSG